MKAIILLLLFFLVGCTNSSDKENLGDNKKATIEVKKPDKDSHLERYPECNDCDIDKAVDLKYKSDYSEITVRKFLCSFHQSCSENVEFSQIANECLFICLEKKTDLSLKIISSMSDSKIKLILSNLRSPIHDGVNIEGSKESVLNSSSGIDDVRVKIIEALNEALAKV